MPSYSKSSTDKLDTCHSDLQRLFEEVIRHRDCTIITGNRNREDQEKAFQEGKSKAHYGQSFHNYSPSLAVDVMPYPIDWDDIKGIHEFAGFVLGVAAAMNIRIQWGGHFKSFFDGPHYELIGVSGVIPS